jgi:hypothetical protein
MSEIEMLRQQVENLKRQNEILSKKKAIDVSPDSFQTIDNPMSRAILFGLEKLLGDDNSNAIVKMYTKMWSFGNYAIICGVGGTAVNYLVLSGLVSILPLIIADVIAILTAAIWNYTLTVGYLGYLSGLAPKKNKGEWFD